MILTIYSPDGAVWTLSGDWHHQESPPLRPGGPPVVGYVRLDRPLRVDGATMLAGERLVIEGEPTIVERRSGRILYTRLARGVPLAPLRGAWVCAWRAEVRA